MPTLLCQALKRYRTTQGLSFELLSARAHVDVAYLHGLETGRKNKPSRDVMIRIAFGLGIDLSETDNLLALAGHSPLTPPRTDRQPITPPSPRSVASPA